MSKLPAQPTVNSDVPGVPPGATKFPAHTVGKPQISGKKKSSMIARLRKGKQPPPDAQDSEMQA